MFFIRMETPELKGLQGFNHMALGWMVNDDVVSIIEPALHGANIDFVYTDDVVAKASDCEILIVDVRATTKQKLFREHFQTCATMVQYLAGIDLGATLVQTFYERLTTSDEAYLKKHGIRKVIKWESKAKPQAPS